MLPALFTARERDQKDYNNQNTEQEHPKQQGFYRKWRQILTKAIIWYTVIWNVI